MQRQGFGLLLLALLVFVIYEFITIVQFMLWQGMPVMWFFATDIARFVVATFMGYGIYRRVKEINPTKKGGGR